MLNRIKKRFALSTKGAKNFCKGTLLTTALDLTLMLPAVFAFLFLDDYVRPLFDQAKRDVTEHIREGLEAIREIKSYSREDDYLRKPDLLTAKYEKIQTKGELLTGVLVNSANSFMKLGLACVVIVGAADGSAFPSPAPC
jgi:ATP-binding cassette subfamily B protein